jgi:hypothetical protein
MPGSGGGLGRAIMASGQPFGAAERAGESARIRRAVVSEPADPFASGQTT